MVYLLPEDKRAAALSVILKLKYSFQALMIAQDDQGNIPVYFSCYDGDLSLIFDEGGSALASPESINATQTGKSLFAKVKETGSIYYLFTIGATGVPYYHVIDMALNGGLGELVSINNPIASQGGYLESMALIQDHTGVGITTLYLVHSTPTGFVDVLDLKAFNVQELGVTFKGSLGVINAAPESDCGLDISPDGSKLAINYGFFSQDYIHLYSLSPDHTPHDDFSYSVGFGDVSSSITFSPESQYLYFSQDFGNPLSPSQGIRRIALADGTVTDVYNSMGEVITAENGKLYAYTADLTSNNELIEISSPDQTPVAQTISLDLQGTEAFLSGLPVQPHMVSKVKDRLKERVLRAKVYEISDHLGNVRSVIADVKVNESLAGGGVEQRAEILMSSDYYPFGMTIGETHVESEGYRYGFNGMEQDDEIKGDGNSYDFGARMYDSRVGRWLSVDPLYSKYPSTSSFCFNRNNPVYFVDLDGKEWVNYYDALVDKTKKALLDNPNSKKLSRKLNRLKKMQAEVNEIINTMKEFDVALYNYVENLEVVNSKTGEKVNVKVTVRLGGLSDPRRSRGGAPGKADALTTYTRVRDDEDGDRMYMEYESLEGKFGRAPAPTDENGEIGFDVIIFNTTGSVDVYLANEVGDVMYKMEYPAEAFDEKSNSNMSESEYRAEGGSPEYSRKVDDKYAERKKDGSGKSSSNNPYPLEK